ncbi:hypothetical protein FWG86_00095 [Candidatus Saccharibacteria bacterium]|nr:hypothetical protein [Candidatus Saccharibacteria bacterium]
MKKTKITSWVALGRKATIALMALVFIFAAAPLTAFAAAPTGSRESIGQQETSTGTSVVSGFNWDAAFNVFGVMLMLLAAIALIAFVYHLFRKRGGAPVGSSEKAVLEYNAKTGEFFDKRKLEPKRTKNGINLSFGDDDDASSSSSSSSSSSGRKTVTTTYHE